MIGNIKESHRLVNDIPGYEDFPGYAVSRSGNVYSLKQFRVRKLKPGYHKGKYPRVILKDKNSNNKTVYLSQLVAAAFIPKDGSKCILRLKDKESNRYSADNLHYVKIGKFNDYVPKEIELSDDMIENIKKLYGASITKGIPNIPSDVNLFLEKIMKDSIDEYISRYGLRRLLA
jgi:hypothetical protein